MTDEWQTEIFKHLSDQITAKLEAHIAEQDRKHEVVLNGMWQAISVLSTIITSLNPTLEWLYDRIPEADRGEAAKRMDAVHKAMRSVNALIAPMRDIMEGGKR